MKSVGDIVSRWEKHGLITINELSLHNHYSILFDDEKDGFKYIFDVLGVDVDEFLQSTDPKVLEVFEEVDDGMYEVSYYVENFVRDVLLSDHYDIDDAKEELEQLRCEIDNCYQEIFNKIVGLKTHFKEEVSNG